MGHINFKNYLTKFEKEVVLEGVLTETFDTIQMVSVKSNALSGSSFSSFMGRVLPYDEVLVLDYYGYMKKSYGFLHKAEKEIKTLGHRQLKMISSVVVHFNSIKIEEINSLTNNTYLISNFTLFKEMILEKRGFRNGT